MIVKLWISRKARAQQTLYMFVVFRRPGNDQSVLFAVNIPAAPCRLVVGLIRRRNQVPVRNPSVEEELVFPLLDSLELFVGRAKCFYIQTSERPDARRFAREQDDRLKRCARLSDCVVR